MRIRIDYRLAVRNNRNNAAASLISNFGLGNCAAREPGRNTDPKYLKSFGDPQDIAGCVLYLLRDATYVTGQIISVDGGRSIA